MSSPSDAADERSYLQRHKRLMWVLAVLSVAIGYAITYVLPMDGWPQWRRIGAGAVMGLWCAYLVVMTRAGGAFK